MLGAIAGDIVGSPYEFTHNNIKTTAFPLFCARSHFTDDTVMTLAVARGLRLAHGDPHATREAIIDAMHDLGALYPGAGYGQRFARWVYARKRDPYNSCGNGSAMRVSPVAWACGSLEEVECYARISAEVTHNHPEGIKGACAVAAAIFLGRGRERTGVTRADIRTHVCGRYGYDLRRTLADIRPGYVHTELCQESVPEAITAFLEARDFEDALRLAVSIGGDSDTIAAIAGSMAESWFGGVPEAIRREVLARLDDRLRGEVAAWEAWLASREPRHE